MPQHASPKKRLRSDHKKNSLNRYQKKSCMTAIKALKADKMPETQLKKVLAMIDKLAKRGIFHKNKSARIKSQMKRFVNNQA